MVLLFTELSFGQDSNMVDFLRGLNTTISEFDLSNQSKKNEGILLMPGFYISSKWETYINVGFMLKPMYQIDPRTEEEESNILIKAAFFIRRKKTNFVLLLDYNKDESWGISVRLKF